MSFERTVSHYIAIKSIRVFDFVIEKNTLHVRNGRVWQVGSKQTAGIFKVGHMMTLMSCT